MSIQEEFRLSFYREIASINEKHRVVLVQHTDTGKIFIKKELLHYDLSVYEFIRDNKCPGIPVIRDLIEMDGKLIVVEDYISGNTVDEMLETGPADMDETARIISALCDILEPLHSRKPPIIHRDIKSSNVIVSSEGRVYLIDFDASKSVNREKNRDTDLIGTEEYAAPEQYGFRQSDQRTDIYALGVLTHKLLTGKFPSECDYEGGLASVIARATAMDPENRYQDVRSLKTAIKRRGNDGVSVSENEKPSEEQDWSNEKLRSFLNHLPYPVRELPGFRSARPWYFFLAVLWYVFIMAVSCSSNRNKPEYTHYQVIYYDVASFFLMFIPTLYAGNYLGVRDRIPWTKRTGTGAEILRISAGILIVAALIIIAVSAVGILVGITE